MNSFLRYTLKIGSLHVIVYSRHHLSDIWFIVQIIQTEKDLTELRKRVAAAEEAAKNATDEVSHVIT